MVRIDNLEPNELAKVGMTWTARIAAKETKKRGGVFEGHGAERDYYRMPDGAPVPIHVTQAISRSA